MCIVLHIYLFITCGEICTVVVLPVSIITLWKFVTGISSAELWAGGGVNRRTLFCALPDKISAVGVIRLRCFGPLRAAWLIHSPRTEAVSDLPASQHSHPLRHSSGKKLYIIITSLRRAQLRAHGTFRGSRMSSVRHRLRGITLLASLTNGDVACTQGLYAPHNQAYILFVKSDHVPVPLWQICYPDFGSFLFER